MLLKNGGGFKEVWICLLPFAACFFLGTGIGVGVGHDENPWVDIVLFGLIAGAFIFVGSLSASILSKKAAQKRLQLPEDFVLVLDFEGSDLTEKPDDPITKLQSGSINQVQLSKMIDALQHAGSDKRIQGMVGCIGDAQKHGGLAQVQELRNAVLGFRELKQDAVPTVAYSDSFGEGGGSGTLGYYLASAFDQIYVQETGLVSFTGFAASTPFLRGLLDKWHIKPLGFAREEYKSVVSQYTDKEYSKANKEATRALLHSWMGQIVTDVAVARGMTTAQVRKALNTSPLSAPEAAAAGLLTGVSHRKSKPQVAVITVTGIIVSGTSAPGLRQQKQSGSTEVGRELQKARHDPKVKAVVLRLDSPGGSAVGSDAIYQEVVKVQQAGKPVVVSMGNLAASGGYYISASADKIVAQPGTITGSIGVAFGKFNASQALKHQGINVDTVAVGRNATAQSLFHDFTKEQRRQVNVLMDRTYGHFLSRVSVGRNLTLSETPSWPVPGR
ncbi:hypothetical protein WJX77_000567 [Trebouxia sp. C0004]